MTRYKKKKIEKKKQREAFEANKEANRLLTQVQKIEPDQPSPLKVNTVKVKAENKNCKDFLLTDAKAAHLLNLTSRPERFHLERLIGVGGMCEVYEATDLRRLECGDSKPKVALKRLLPKFAQNIHAQLLLAQEFFILRHITHYGVVRVFDLHREPAGLCFSMELLRGSTAQDCLIPNDYHSDDNKNIQNYNFQKKSNIAAELYKILAFLHAKGVIHADLKPANIFMTQEERIVLFDFNISQIESKIGSACTEISQGLKTALKLTAYSQLHVSPERLQGGNPSKQDDVFAASCTVYELLTGAHPFKRLPATQAEEKKLQVARIAQLPTRQWLCLKQGLSFNPSARPEASELYSVFKSKKWYETKLFNEIFI